MANNRQIISIGVQLDYKKELDSMIGNLKGQLEALKKSAKDVELSASLQKQITELDEKMAALADNTNDAFRTLGDKVDAKSFEVFQHEIKGIVNSLKEDFNKLKDGVESAFAAMDATKSLELVRNVETQFAELQNKISSTTKVIQDFYDLVEHKENAAITINVNTDKIKEAEELLEKLLKEKNRLDEIEENGSGRVNKGMKTSRLEKELHQAVDAYDKRIQSQEELVKENEKGTVDFFEERYAVLEIQKKKIYDIIGEINQILSDPDRKDVSDWAKSVLGTFAKKSESTFQIDTAFKIADAFKEKVKKMKEEVVESAEEATKNVDIGEFTIKNGKISVPVEIKVLQATRDKELEVSIKNTVENIQRIIKDKPVFIDVKLRTRDKGSKTDRELLTTQEKVREYFDSAESEVQTLDEKDIGKNFFATFTEEAKEAYSVAAVVIDKITKALNVTKLELTIDGFKIDADALKDVKARINNLFSQATVDKFIQYFTDNFSIALKKNNFESALLKSLNSATDQWKQHFNDAISDIKMALQESDYADDRKALLKKEIDAGVKRAKELKKTADAYKNDPEKSTSSLIELQQELAKLSSLKSYAANRGINDIEISGVLKQLKDVEYYNNEINRLYKERYKKDVGKELLLDRTKYLKELFSAFDGDIADEVKPSVFQFGDSTAIDEWKKTFGDAIVVVSSDLEASLSEASSSSVDSWKTRMTEAIKDLPTQFDNATKSSVDKDTNQKEVVDLQQAPVKIDLDPETITLWKKSFLEAITDVSSVLQTSLSSSASTSVKSWHDGMTAAINDIANKFTNSIKFTDGLASLIDTNSPTKGEQFDELYYTLTGWRDDDVKLNQLRTGTSVSESVLNSIIETLKKNGKKISAEKEKELKSMLKSVDSDRNIYDMFNGTLERSGIFDLSTGKFLGGYTFDKPHGSRGELIQSEIKKVKDLSSVIDFHSHPNKRDPKHKEVPVIGADLTFSGISGDMGSFRQRHKQGIKKFAVVAGGKVHYLDFSKISNEDVNRIANEYSEKLRTLDVPFHRGKHKGKIYEQGVFDYDENTAQSQELLQNIIKKVTGIDGSLVSHIFDVDDIKKNPQKLRDIGFLPNVQDIDKVDGAVSHTTELLETMADAMQKLTDGGGFKLDTSSVDNLANSLQQILVILQRIHEESNIALSNFGKNKKSTIEDVQQTFDDVLTNNDLLLKKGISSTSFRDLLLPIFKQYRDVTEGKGTSGDLFDNVLKDNIEYLMSKNRLPFNSVEDASSNIINWYDEYIQKTKEVANINEELAKTQKTVNLEEGIKFDISSEDLEKIASSLREILDIMQQLYNASGVAKLQSQWSLIEEQFNGVAKKDGSIDGRNKKKFAELIDTIYQYQQMGGGDISSLTDNKETINKINKQLANYKKKSVVEEVQKPIGNNITSDETDELKTTSSEIAQAFEKIEATAKEFNKALQPTINNLNRLIELLSQDPQDSGIGKDLAEIGSGLSSFDSLNNEKITALVAALRSLAGIDFSNMESSSAFTALIDDLNRLQTQADVIKDIAAIVKETKGKTAQIADSIEEATNTKSSTSGGGNGRKKKNAIPEDVYSSNYVTWAANRKAELEQIFERVGETAIKRTASGIVKMTNVVQAADGSWQKLTATMDNSFKTFEESFTPLSKTQGMKALGIFSDKEEKQLQSDLKNVLKFEKTYETIMAKARGFGAVDVGGNLIKDKLIPKLTGEELKALNDIEEYEKKIETARKLLSGTQLQGQTDALYSAFQRMKNDTGDFGAERIRKATDLIQELDNEVEEVITDLSKFSDPSAIRAMEKVRADYSAYITDYINGIDERETLDKRTGQLLSKYRNVIGFYNGMDSQDAREAYLKDYIKSTYGNFDYDFSKGSKMPESSDVQKVVAQYKDLNGIVRTVTASIDTSTKAVRVSTTASSEYVNGLDKFFTSLKAKVFEGLRYLMAYVSIQDIWRYFRQGVEVVREFDTALTEMRKVSDEALITLQKYQGESFNIADDVGTTALQIQQSTADFMRLGDTLKEAKENAKTANVLMNVSEFESIDEATTSLIAMEAAYKDLSGTEIIDKLNNIGNHYAIATDGIATALQVSASALTTAGNDIDESIALITAGNAILQDPDKVGNGMRTIALRLTGTKAAAEELEEIGEDTTGMITTESKLRKTIMEATKTEKTPGGFDILDNAGQYKSTYEILEGIAEIWTDIKELDKKNGTTNQNLLLETMAGKNRANILASILQNPDILQNSYMDSQISEGSAQEELDKYLDSMEARIQKFKNAAQELAFDFLDSDTIKVFIDFGTKLINILDEIVEHFNFVTAAAALFSSGLLQSIKHPLISLKKDKNGNWGFSTLFHDIKKEEERDQSEQFGQFRKWYNSGNAIAKATETNQKPEVNVATNVEKVVVDNEKKIADTITSNVEADVDSGLVTSSANSNKKDVGIRFKNFRSNIWQKLNRYYDEDIDSEIESGIKKESWMSDEDYSFAKEIASYRKKQYNTANLMLDIYGNDIDFAKAEGTSLLDRTNENTERMLREKYGDNEQKIKQMTGAITSVDPIVEYYNKEASNIQSKIEPAKQKANATAETGMIKEETSYRSMKQELLKKQAQQDEGLRSMRGFTREQMQFVGDSPKIEETQYRSMKQELLKQQAQQDEGLRSMRGFTREQMKFVGDPLDDVPKKMSAISEATKNASKEAMTLTEAFDQYLANGGNMDDVWKSKMEDFKNAITESNGAIEDSWEGFKKWRAEAEGATGGVADSLKNIGANLVTTFASAATSMAVSFAIQGIITLIYNYVTASQRAIEAGQEARNVINDTAKSIQSTNNTIKSLGEISRERLGEVGKQAKNTSESIDYLAKRYVELRRGTSNNENVSLSDSDYQEFLDISNQLVQIMPELQYGTDASGNAILNLGNNADDASNKIKSLYDNYLMLQNSEIQKNFRTGLDGLTKELEGLEQEDFSVTLTTEQADKYLRHGKRQKEDGSYVVSWEDMVENGDAIMSAYRSNINWDKLDPEHTVNVLERLQQIQGQFLQAQQMVSEIVSQTSSYISSSDVFGDLSYNLQQDLLGTMPNIRDMFKDMFIEAGEDENVYTEMIYARIIAPLNAISNNTQIQEKIHDLLNIDTSDINLDGIKDKYAEVLGGALGDAYSTNEDLFNRLFGFDKYKDIQDKFQNLMSRTDFITSANLDDIAENFSLSDMELAYKVLLEDNDHLIDSYEKLKEAMISAREAAIDETSYLNDYTAAHARAHSEQYDTVKDAVTAESTNMARGIKNADYAGLIGGFDKTTTPTISATALIPNYEGLSSAVTAYSNAYSNVIKQALSSPEVKSAIESGTDFADIKLNVDSKTAEQFQTALQNILPYFEELNLSQESFNEFVAQGSANMYSLFETFDTQQRAMTYFTDDGIGVYSFMKDVMDATKESKELREAFVDIGKDGRVSFKKNEKSINELSKRLNISTEAAGYLLDAAKDIGAVDIGTIYAQAGRNSLSGFLADLQAVSTAMSEISQNGYLTYETMTNLVTANGAYANGLVNTSSGMILNNEEMQKLNEEAAEFATANIQDSVNQLTDEFVENSNVLADYVNKGGNVKKVLDDIAKSNGDVEAAAKAAGASADEYTRIWQAYSENESIGNTIIDLQRQQSEIRANVSLMQEYKNALQTPNMNANFLTTVSGKEGADKLYEQGWWGTDDFATYAKLIGQNGWDDKTAILNYQESLQRVGKYLTEDASGVFAFFDDAIAKGEDLGVTFDDLDGYKLNIDNMEEFAKKMEVTTEFAENMVLALHDAGQRDIDLSMISDGIRSDLSQLGTSILNDEKTFKNAINMTQRMGDNAESALDKIVIARKAVDQALSGKDMQATYDLFNQTFENAQIDESGKIAVTTEVISQSIDGLKEHIKSYREETDKASKTDMYKNIQEEMRALSYLDIPTINEALDLNIDPSATRDEVIDAIAEVADMTDTEKLSMKLGIEIPEDTTAEVQRQLSDLQDAMDDLNELKLNPDVSTEQLDGAMDRVLRIANTLDAESRKQFLAHFGIEVDEQGVIQVEQTKANLGQPVQATATIYTSQDTIDRLNALQTIVNDIGSEHDGKVVIEGTEEAQEEAESLAEYLAGLPEEQLIAIGFDTSKGIDKQTILNQIGNIDLTANIKALPTVGNNQTVTVTVNGAKEGAQDVDKLNSSLTTLSQFGALSVNINTAAALGAIAGLQGVLDALGATVTQPTVSMALANFYSDAKVVDATLKGISGKTATPHVSLDYQSFIRGAGAVSAGMSSLSSLSAYPHVSLSGGGYVDSLLDSIRTKMNTLDGRTATMYINTVRHSSSGGGKYTDALGTVHANASGTANAYAGGTPNNADIAIKNNETALVNELGYESIVFSCNFIQ